MKNEATHTKPQNGHLTIGLLENNIGHAVNGEQWLGVTDAAKERSVNLICFAGPSQTERGELRSQLRFQESLI